MRARVYVCTNVSNINYVYDYVRVYEIVNKERTVEFMS